VWTVVWALMAAGARARRKQCWMEEAWPAPAERCVARSRQPRVNIANAKTSRLAHPQPASIDQLKDHSESRLMDRRQKSTHFLPLGTIGSLCRKTAQAKMLFEANHG
jgi:hypothetical protein